MMAQHANVCLNLQHPHNLARCSLHRALTLALLSPPARTIAPAPDGTSAGQTPAGGKEAWRLGRRRLGGRQQGDTSAYEAGSKR
jgi:hypothetical protein